MPHPGSEPPLADRWLAELAAARAGGPMRRMRARGRIRNERVEYDEGLLFELLTPRIFRPGVVLPLLTEVGLYPLGSAAGTLPSVVVEMPPDGVLEALTAQRGEVDVRGEPAPGHGIVLVLDDGEVIGCRGPARPPPPVFAGHWRLPG